MTAVEISADAIAAAAATPTRNGLTGIEWREANVFDLLPAEERRGAQYDLIILDPPSFTKSKGKLDDAMRGYKEIHLRALKLLSDDGLLATFCCSHHVSAAEFRQMIIDASVDARRSVRQLARYTQAADHPVIPTLPETEYLQGYLYEAHAGTLTSESRTAVRSNDAARVPARQFSCARHIAAASAGSASS